MIRILVNGANGRMGQEVCRAIRSAKDLALVGECDLGDSLEKGILSSRAQVVVDFTEPRSAFRNAKTILSAGARPVIGTTGFQAKDIVALQRIAARKRLGGLIAPNFSIGALVLDRLAAMTALHFDSVEIIELHHDGKADAPSGTAEKTAAAINASAKRPLNVNLSRSVERLRGVRGGKIGRIPLHSIRLPGLLAHQEVLFGGPGQLLTLRHDVTSREAYMPGVILAIRRAPSLRTLVFGLENLLFPE